MAKYRRKSIIMDAIQWDGTDSHPDVEKFIQKGDLDAAGDVELYEVFVVRTPIGLQELHPGDWIVVWPEGGGTYPCKPNTFEVMYEPVEENQND